MLGEKTQQYLPQLADEMFQMQSGLGVKQTPRDAEQWASEVPKAQ